MTRAQWHCDLEQMPEIDRLNNYSHDALRRVGVYVPECGPDCGLAAEAER